MLCEKIAFVSQKRPMHGVWKDREKLLEKVICTTSERDASIREIAGNAVQAIKALDLSCSDDHRDN